MKDYKKGRRLPRALSAIALASAGMLAALPLSGHAALVGQWTFEGSNALSDSTGNFGDLQLHGNAQIVNGELVVSGTGTSATGWANAVGNFTSSPIGDKTLVSWITLTNTSAWAGAAMSIDKSNTDQFDAIVLGERQTDTWMNGSSFFRRTQDQFSGPETAIGTRLMMAITYDVTGSNVQITGYRNGTSIGSYNSGNAAVWGDSFTEVLFGPRHSASNTTTYGAINARIDEARLYDTALTQTQLAALAPVPEPETYAMMLAGLGVLGAAARRRQRKESAAA